MARRDKIGPPPPIHIPALTSDRFARGLTNTIELAPPARLDDPEFQEKVRYYGFLMDQGIVQGVTIPDWPRYPPWFVSATTLVTRLLNILGLGLPLPWHHFVDPVRLLAHLHQQWTHIARRRLIFTIGAQHFSAPTIADKIIAADRAGATDFLVVSGGAPKRRLYNALANTPGFTGCRGWLLPMDALKVIELVQHLQAQGSISSRATIMAAHNPYVDAVERVTQKIQAGVRMLLTQPPILWDDALQRHWQALHAQGVMDKVSVGVPYIPSAKALRFWYFLIGIPWHCGWLPGPCVSSRRKDAWLQYHAFRQHERIGRQTLGQFMHTWNAHLLKDIQRLPDVAGTHTMPAMAWRRLVGTDYYCHDVHRLVRAFHDHGVRLDIAPHAMVRTNVRDLYRVLLALERLVRQGKVSMAELHQVTRVYVRRTIRAHTSQLPRDTREFVVIKAGRVRDTDARDIIVDLRQARLTQAHIEHKLWEALRQPLSETRNP